MGCRTPKCCGLSYKYEWLNLVGVDFHQAKAIIERDNPNVKVFPLPKGTVVILDFCCNRVKLFYDKKNYRVARVPILPSRNPCLIIGPSFLYRYQEENRTKVWRGIHADA
ncbi:hypothetical protein CDL12_01996 [Handroanthus impetiginosus]|uniref:Uncharacterized protein n=1 Tax=Handroanthus impetiginosus TaxID=429701 RepID=A0A2G9I6J9_9LAMI|nr:hypothetical protein CDL12_01996 [Handroanthus impetiginosus]